MAAAYNTLQRGGASYTLSFPSTPAKGQGMLYTLHAQNLGILCTLQVQHGAGGGVEGMLCTLYTQYQGTLCNLHVQNRGRGVCVEGMFCTPHAQHPSTRAYFALPMSSTGVCSALPMPSMPEHTGACSVVSRIYTHVFILVSYQGQMGVNFCLDEVHPPSRVYNGLSSR